MTRSRLLLALTLILALSIPGMAYADNSPPPMPLNLTGTVVNTSGASVSSGTVNAYIDDTLRGSVDLKNGAFSTATYNPLVVSGDETTVNKPVSFKVVIGSLEYAATSSPAEVIWEKGEFKTVKLTVDLASITVPAPTASPSPGTYTSSQSVTLACSITGASIYYTTDSSDPANGPNKKTYTGAITVSSTKTIKAVAYINGKYSDVATFSYIININNTGWSTEDPVTVTSQDASISLSVGQTKQLQISVSPGDANLSYVSDNLGVATVSDAGLVTAVAKGTAYITVTGTETGRASGATSILVTVTGQSGATTTPTTPATGETAAAFSDVKGHWAEAIVLDLAGKGIFSGYPDNTFRPDDSITRAECAAIITKALNVEAGDTKALEGFTDAAEVPQWAQQPLAAVVGAGLLKGVPDGDGKMALRAQDRITRQELAVIIAGAMEKKLGEQQPGTNVFADQDQIPDWALPGIQIVAGKSVVAGYPDNTFRGANEIKRAEAAAMVSNFLKLLT